MAVAGEVDDAGARASAPGARAAARAPSTRSWPRAGVIAGERAQERALAVALDAGEADDLAGRDAQGDVVEAGAAEARRPRAAPRGRSPLARACAGKTWSTARPMISRRISPSEMPGGVEGAARLAVAQDGDAVGDALDLGQAVGDVDDRRALLADRADVLEQALALDRA